MIGLGSNRLSVCRRGGMRVTQAGRGGMEWLAGGRVPSWASPYSAQATAALKDAFTAAQWVIIRDYGFAHPEIVPYVNQYPMIAPYLCGIYGLSEEYPLMSAKNYVFGYNSTNTTEVEVVSRLMQAGDSSWLRIVSAGSWGTSNGMYIDTKNSTMTIVWNTSTNTYTWSSSDIGKDFTTKVTQSQWILKQAGVTKKTANGSAWYGVAMSVNGNARWNWKCCSVKQGGSEVHRYFALTDNMIWDYVTETLIDNN